MDQKVDARGEAVQAGAAVGEDGGTPLAAPRLFGIALPRLGLSSKLLVLTVLFVMLAEVLIFLPSVANFRVNWLMDRLTAARLAALAAEASPTGDVPLVLRDELLRTAQVKAVSIKRDGERRLILATTMPDAVDETYDLTLLRSSGGWRLGTRLSMFWDAVALYWSDGKRTIRVMGNPGGLNATGVADDLVDIVLPEAPLRAAMIRFGLNIMALSVIISIITAALVYMALNFLLVRPMMRIAGNMLRFSKNPEDQSRVIQASSRRDEIGTTERELAHMQTELSQLLAQKNRLAALGLAVSKINHDLRNLLANAQLLSDRLTSSPDPTVQSFAPKLIASLDRAIAFCNDTLTFGRAAERPPRREKFALRDVVDEVGDALALPRQGSVAWLVEVPPEVKIDADRDHLFRVLSNLVRNSVQVLEAQAPAIPGEIAVSAQRRDTVVVIRVTDNGPGVPKRAREHLFKAFQGSVRKGGTGLGLAIAHELIGAHGGTIRLVDTPRGSTFEIVVPDRAKS